MDKVSFSWASWFSKFCSVGGFAKLLHLPKEGGKSGGVAVALNLKLRCMLNCLS